ncbi:hypothetical protein RBA63_10080 [Brenneria goodwinii]
MYDFGVVDGGFQWISLDAQQSDYPVESESYRRWWLSIEQEIGAGNETNAELLSLSLLTLIRYSHYQLSLEISLVLGTGQVNELKSPLLATHKAYKYTGDI